MSIAPGQIMLCVAVIVFFAFQILPHDVTWLKHSSLDLFMIWWQY